MFLKILIVDDDAAMLKLYERIFCGQDYSITLGDGLGTELTQLFRLEFPHAKSLVVTGSLSETTEFFRPVFGAHIADNQRFEPLGLHSNTLDAV